MRLPHSSILLLSILACSKPAADRATTDTPSAATRTFVAAASAPKNALASVRWIVGKFRGVGAEGTVQVPFFERYSLLDDSTLVVESFSDSTLSGKPDSTRYELRGDSLTDAGAQHYAASVVSSDSLVFSPRAGANNSFTWRKGDDTSWTAVITPMPGKGTPRVYRMARIK